MEPDDQQIFIFPARKILLTVDYDVYMMLPTPLVKLVSMISVIIGRCGNSNGSAQSGD
jgi:hypothetical protein